MLRLYSCEGAEAGALDLVPLSVRRKLDLCRLKIPLAGWRALSFAERLALGHLPADTDEEIAAFARVLRGFAERAGVALQPLDEEDGPLPWRASAVPAAVRLALERAGLALADEEWNRLGDEDRYALAKLADSKKGDERFVAVLREVRAAW